jgi:hypothetical protein
LKDRRREMKIAALVMAVMFGCLSVPGCAVGTTAVVTGEATVNESAIAAGSAGFAYWEANSPDCTWLRLAEGDIDGDGVDDLLVVYRTGEDKYVLAAVLDKGNKFLITNTLPAPITDQVISIFDMDHKSPNEVLISGRKGKNAGSAVLRVENGALEILFSSGYGNCCG